MYRNVEAYSNEASHQIVWRRIRLEIGRIAPLHGRSVLDFWLSGGRQALSRHREINRYLT
jgi:hypothetical protein